MDNPVGKVLSLVDRPDGAHALVAVQNAPVCARCAAGKGCGAGLLATPNGEQRIEAHIPAGLEVEINDNVEVSLAPASLLHAAAVVYGIPMLGALLAAAVAYSASLGDAGAAVASLLGLGAGLVVSRSRLRKPGCLRSFTPSVKRLC
jgi:sigma-E factor negative regulatory protein RseC